MTLAAVVALVLAAMVLGAACLSACASPAPDTILFNGKVFTANAAQPWAEALAIRGERIVAVGDTAAITARARPSTRRLDLGGRTVVPGFNDAHQHVEIGPDAMTLALPDEPTIDQIAAALKLALASATPGQMIRGLFGQTAWGEPSFTRTWLDAQVADRPVWLTGFTGHGVLLNSAALALVALTDDVSDPDGGRFVRDGQGRLNGRLEEYAGELAERRLALTVPPSMAADLYRKFAIEASGFGITTIQLIADPLPIAETSKRLVEANAPMRWRAYRFPMREAGGDTIDSRPTLPPQPTPRIDVRGMKWILDGTPIERLGFMRAPYSDAPGERGRLNLPASRIDQFVGWAYGSEDPLLVHAFGDAAIDAYLSALERTGRPEVWRAKRPRIEHGDMMSPDLRVRAKAIGAVVVQNPSHFTFPEVFLQRYGVERVAWMQPMKSLLDAGIPLAIGSDGPMNPFLNVLWASTHSANPREALTREQAVTAYTRGSAFAEFAERDKGQLAVGMLADLAVLSADVFTVPQDQMEPIRSVLTIIGGRTAHDSGVLR